VAEIKQLEKEIDRLGKQSSSTQQGLNEELRQKDLQLAEKERVVAGFGEALRRQEAAIDAVLEEFRSTLADLPPTDYACEHRDYRGIVVLAERLLFKPGTDQFAKTANPLLEKLARVINAHPELQVQVTGHADSQSALKGFANRLDFSTGRATAAAQVLVRDFYVNGSQVTAAGRADFEPRASNETEEGRSLNRRLEVVFQPRVDEVRRLAGK
jgi:chemotaxis protein MotB